MYKTSIVFISLIPVFSGCIATSKLLEENVAPKVHDYSKSTEALKECKFDNVISIVHKNQNELLKNSELGLVYYFKNAYKKSNRAFDVAINKYRNNENKAIISLSNIFRNEYQGEGFDKVFLHNYKAINYLILGDAEGARIEAKNSNSIQQEERIKLRNFTEKYTQKNKNSQLVSRYDVLFNKVHPQHHPYQNPFAYYISALGYAEDGDYENAKVNISNAIKFSTNSKILKDKLSAYNEGKNERSVELFFDVGQSPLKSQVKLNMDMGNGEERMAYLPSYILNRSSIDYIKITNSKNEEVARSFVLSDINAIKINEFKEKLPAMLSILTKEISLTIGSEALDKKSKILSTVFKTGTAIYGQNDVSTWSLLPEKILVLSFVPDVKESYQISIVDKSGKTLSQEALTIDKTNKLKNIYKHYTLRDRKICK